MPEKEGIPKDVWLNICMVVSRRKEIYDALRQAGNYHAEDAVRPCLDALAAAVKENDPFPVIAKVHIETPDDSPLGW